MKLLTTVIASLLTGVLARSSVYVVSNRVHELEIKPEVALNAFSMFYAHMMDNTAKHPAFQIQDTNQLQEISPILSNSDSLFEKKTDANLMVVIAGVEQPQDMITQYDTSFYVTEDDSHKYSALVEDIAEQDITLYKNQKVQMNNGDALTFDEKELIDNFNSNFFNYRIELFDVARQVDKDFVIELEMIKELADLDATKLQDVRVIEVNSLKALGDAYGVHSDEYKEAQLMIKNLFEKLVIPKFQQLYSRGVTTLVLTPYSRQSSNVPEFFAEGETCFTSAKSCANGTASCSGNGQCTLIKENCYACQCKSSAYVGESCQYVNAVGDFQLLFWTSVLLIVITTSVVVCVYQSGSNTDAGIIMTQSAPKQD